MDGYITLNGKKTVLEALGCFYHGHPECYSSDTVNPVCNQKMSSLYQETLQRFQFIEAMGYSVQYKWECEFNREKANNPEIEQYLNEKNFVSPHYNRANASTAVDAMHLDYITKFREMKRYGMWTFVHYIPLSINTVNTQQDILEFSQM